MIRKLIVFLIMFLCIISSALAVTYVNVGPTTEFTGNVGTTGNYYISNVQITSDALSDVASIAMLNENEMIIGNWVNTTNPWADNEVSDTLTASDLVAGSSVVADAEVDNDITIDLATLATTFTATDNESEALACPIVFVDGATGAQGAETDGDLTYNPSTGTVTATIFAGALSGNATTCTTASAGDAAVDFFGGSVSAVTDATTCTDLEGTLLSIATGTLNAAIPEDHIDATMLKDDNAPADDDIFSYELTGTTGHWYSRAEVGIGLATSITDGLILEADLNADEAPADNDILTYDTTGANFSWQTLAELGIQPLDASLTSIAALTYASDSFIKVTAEDTYAIRTLAQVKADLDLEIGTDIQAYSAVNALTTDKLSVFAATTSAELAGVISDETGTGALVFANSPNINLYNALASDHTYSGLTDSQPVGESVVFGDLLYFDWTDVEWKKAKADVFATAKATRIALESKANGETCLMLVKGYIRDDSAFDFGAARVFLNDDVAGTCDDTAPAESGDQIFVVGEAKSADILFFDPGKDVGEI